MKGTDNRQTRPGTPRNNRRRLLKRRSAAIAGTVLLTGALAVSFTREAASSKVVYAAPETAEELPSGLAGVMYSIDPDAERREPGLLIGSACENVLVGQRTPYTDISREPVIINVSTQMESTVNGYAMKAQNLAASPSIMSDRDYDSLLRIVEAEAGIEDIKGKILVANVIMNRVASEYFPNTVYDVVWQNTGGIAQFQPTGNGSIYRVTVSAETREAVRQALDGVDYSEGALFFLAKAASEEKNIQWFERDLKRLFKYGGHEFYAIPDTVDTTKS